MKWCLAHMQMPELSEKVTHIMLKDLTANQALQSKTVRNVMWKNAHFLWYVLGETGTMTLTYVCEFASCFRKTIVSGGCPPTTVQ